MVEQQVISRDSNGRFLPGIVPEGSTPFKPGEVANPTGRPKDAVSTLLKRKDHQAVADKLYALALNGDMKAIDVFLDRTEGKVTEKHLNVNITATPESILEAQERLLNAQADTKALLEKYTKRGAE